MIPIPPPREAGFTTTTDVPLYWLRYGKPGATPLLVLHGGPGAHHDYLLPQFLDLADEYELVFYDQRGGGRSKTDDRTPIGWREHVADLDRVIGELHLTPLSLIGYSWGGLLAMLFAIEAAAGRTTHAPARMVLVDPAPVNRKFRAAFEAEFARRQAGADVAALRADLAASGLRERDPEAYRQRNFELSVAGYFAKPAAAFDLTPFRVTGRVQQSVWESLGDFDLLAPGQLDTVKVPTLILHGRQDPIPIESSRAAAAALGPTTRFIELDASGHVPYVEQREALFESIRLFLEATPL
jgi:Predicted hydrolases or acyltransferases (alpha/beta hydrolase superfamily)